MFSTGSMDATSALGVQGRPARSPRVPASCPPRRRFRGCTECRVQKGSTINETTCQFCHTIQSPRWVHPTRLPSHRPVVSHVCSWLGPWTVAPGGAWRGVASGQAPRRGYADAALRSAGPDNAAAATPWATPPSGRTAPSMARPQRRPPPGRTWTRAWPRRGSQSP